MQMIMDDDEVMDLHENTSKVDKERVFHFQSDFEIKMDRMNQSL